MHQFWSIKVLHPSPMEGVGYQANHQPRQTKTASQTVPKKIWITIPYLVPFSNYLQVLFPSSFCQLLTSHLLVRVWLCLLSDLTTGSCGGRARVFEEYQIFPGNMASGIHVMIIFVIKQYITDVQKSEKVFFELCLFCIVQGSLVQG